MDPNCQFCNQIGELGIVLIISPIVVILGKYVQEVGQSVRNSCKTDVLCRGVQK